MGTRADFYVGRGDKAEWLGSIAWDGYPGGNPEPLLKITDEAEYRAAVEAVLKDCADHATRPEMGWPWPWNNSQTTDYAYAFDGGRVWGTCFGHGWWPADAEPEESCEGAKETVFPDMSDRKNVTLGDRSGVIFINL